MDNVYLTKIKTFPLLDAEEEFELAVRYREHKDPSAADKLITSNLKFVVKVALGYRSYGVTLTDLIQEGNIGLMMALKKFDPYRGYRFITYAVWWIRAYIQNFIIRNWSLVKIGTNSAQKKLFYKIGKVRESLESNQEKAERYEMAATELGVAREDIIEMEQRMSSRDFSLDTAFGESSEVTPLDLLHELGMNQEDSLAEEQGRKFQEKLVFDAMKSLTEREVYVIKNRFMADEPLTLAEIGKHLKLSRERVRQIEGEALMKLREKMSCFRAHTMHKSSRTGIPLRSVDNFHDLNVSLKQAA
jgi:RNA polymerase sigma-32 factor